MAEQLKHPNLAKVIKTTIEDPKIYEKNPEQINIMVKEKLKQIALLKALEEQKKIHDTVQAKEEKIKYINDLKDIYYIEDAIERWGADKLGIKPDTTSFTVKHNGETIKVLRRAPKVTVNMNPNLERDIQENRVQRVEDLYKASKGIPIKPKEESRTNK